MLCVTVNRRLCVGAGLCVLSCPDVFEQSEEDGLVVLLVETPSPVFSRQVLAAARTCPSLAIQVAAREPRESK